MQKSTVLVSACLLGVKCRYNAVCGMVDGLEELMECAQLIPVCPETLGGLPTPRPPAERVGNRVVNWRRHSAIRRGRAGMSEAGPHLRRAVRADEGAQPILRRGGNIRWYVQPYPRFGRRRGF